jgi:uncharacterized protein with ParB-like and HNH nuclease domain
MSFQTPITIKQVIDDIHNRKMFLPAIQREFVWKTDRIEKLFDSILQGYPINSFLFWEVKPEKKRDYQFYEFIKDFCEDLNEHNEKANVDTVHSNFSAILDGQQRLTSFYIGLMGSYSERYYRARKGYSSSYFKQYLYINLLSYSEEENKKYNFKFLETHEAEKRDENTFWYKVSEILYVTELPQINDFIYNNDLQGKREAFNILYQLYQSIHHTPVINYFLEKSDELDKVLNIFIRINSGGIQLSYSDMLLSTATAQWKEKDAREEIHSLYDELRSQGFWGINKDWILKACLYLTNINDIRFKVDNFNRQNMELIEEQWDEIKNTLNKTIQLCKRFGYDSYNLYSYNALLPIAHYLHNYEKNQSFETSSHFKEKRQEIFRWINHTTLKKTFSGQSDNVLSIFRKALNEAKDFSFENMKESLKFTSKNMSFSDDEIDSLLETQYGSKLAYPLLNLIYSNPDYDTKQHLDHIHPRSTVEYKYYSNTIINLQLMHGQENIEKQDRIFIDWFNENLTTETQKADYRLLHFIPDVDLSANNFDEFAGKRRELLKNRLEMILK